MRAAEAETLPLNALRKSLPTLPARLREAARFISNHEFDATTRSMRELAAAAGLQPATFTRLAQALGHSGWEEFRNDLIESKRPSVLRPFSGRVRRTGEACSTTELEQLAIDIFRTDANAAAKIDVAPIALAAKALYAAERIWVAGFRSCRSVATLLHYQLRLFRPDDIRLVGGSGAEDCDFGAFKQKDAVVLVGFAPYSRASVLTCRAARDARVTLVTIADKRGAPIADGADHLLFFDAASTPAFFPSLTGAMVTAQALAAATFTLGGENSIRRLRETEARLAALSQYVADEESFQ